uniref:RING-type domain-containing protein n=1 Tax=Meloidogyne floridensis TaxID=298350 RepID=A0A915NLE5_9BILA
MGKIMGVKYTKNCFRKNKKSVNRDGNVLEVKNIFDKIKNKYLILSENYQKKLEEQSFCLANFLFKHFGPDYAGGRTVDNLIEDDFEAIRNNYKICFGGESYVVFSKLKRAMLKEDQITEEFIQDLEECNKILKTKKSIVKIFTDSSSKFANFDNLYNRFNPTQIFYKKFPISVRNFKTKFLENYKYDNECSICLNELNNSVNLTQIIHCKHVFHKNCIESW